MKPPLCRTDLMQSQRSPPLGGVDFFFDLLESVSHRSSFVMVGAGLLRLRRRVGMWLWLPGYGVRVCSRSMRWRWLLLWLLELECRLRRLCFRRCESSRERLCVFTPFRFMGWAAFAVATVARCVILVNVTCFILWV